MINTSIIEVNGVKLYAEEKGNGPTVIFVHGIPTDYRAWRDQVDKLSLDFHTVTYSRRCAPPNECGDYANSTIENNEKDLEGLIQRMGGGPVHLVGHSYGAPVVTLCALSHPEYVRSLVLIEPYLPGMIDRSIDRGSSLAMSALDSLDNIKKTLQEVSLKNMEIALDAYYPRTWERNDVKVPLSGSTRSMMIDNMETFRELMTETPKFNKQDASQIVSSTLILSGEHTTEFMKSVSMELHKGIPNNQIVIIRNASHYPHIENPKECSGAIYKFLSEHIL